MTTIILVLSIVAAKDLHLEQLDVKTVTSLLEITYLK